MVIINTINEKYFSLNGVNYAKIYQPLKQGNENIGIYNVYDTEQQLVGSTHYSEFEIDGSTFSSQSSAIAAMLPIVFNFKIAEDITTLLGLKTDKGGYEGTAQDLKDQIDGVLSGVVGTLAIADTPTEDGIYYASESGTYTNAGGLVVDLDQGINIISVEEGQTVFNLIVIPIDLSGQISASRVSPIFKNPNPDPRAGLIDIVLYGANKSRTYFLDRVANYNPSTFIVAIIISDDQGGDVCSLNAASSVSDYRLSGKKWVSLSERNNSGVTGYAFVDWDAFRDQGILTFKYELNDNVYLGQRSVLNEVFANKKWLKNKGQVIKEYSGAGRDYKVLTAINAIRRVYVESPPYNRVNERLCISRVAKNDAQLNDNTYVTIKNIDQGTTTDLIFTPEEVTEGVKTVELSFSGWLGVYITVDVNWGLIPVGRAYHDLDNSFDLEIEVDKPLKNQWRNKRIVWLGTSIPANLGGEGDAPRRYERSYPVRVCRALGAELYHKAVSGIAVHFDPDGTIQWQGTLSAYLTEYADPLINNEDVDYNSSSTAEKRAFETSLLGQGGDLYVFDLVPNNDNFSLSEWDKFDPATLTFNDSSTFDDNRFTYLGGLLFLYNKLMLENPLHSMVLVSTKFGVDGGVEGRDNNNLFAEAFNIPHIDLIHRQQINAWNQDILQSDGTHQNQYSSDRTSKLLFGEFLRIS